MRDDLPFVDLRQAPLQRRDDLSLSRSGRPDDQRNIWCVERDLDGEFLLCCRLPLLEALPCVGRQGWQPRWPLPRDWQVLEQAAQPWHAHPSLDRTPCVKPPFVLLPISPKREEQKPSRWRVDRTAPEGEQSPFTELGGTSKAPVSVARGQVGVAVITPVRRRFFSLH